MRAGGCTMQQALTPEAAGMIKQAVNLARRRGHAQVTPLHVASTMLASPTGLLRAGCLQSHSHPLQCKALELCFNVALNRLPASTAPSPLLGHHYGGGHHHHHTPSLSNALVAAFKRAQAHQRRGAIESQQQPLLAVKIELEQLIISILDDPSVSRVMREAGFSSTQVKSHVEQAVSSSSLEMCASTTPSSSPKKSKELAAINPFLAAPQASKARPLAGTGQPKAEDVACIVEALSGGRKRSIVVVGECLATSDGVIRGVMDRVDKGEVPEALRNAQFISLPLLSFRGMPREEVDQKVRELKCLVKGCCAGGRGAVLYLEDLKWPAEYRAISFGDKGRSCYYCPIEHVIMEIRSMVFGGDQKINYGGSTGRFWVLGIATYQSFMRCKVGHPSLATLWDLQPLTTPSGSLKLTLNFDSSDHSQSPLNNKIHGDGRFWSTAEDAVRSQLTCCEDCSINFESEARSLPNIYSTARSSSASSTLPSWLQQYKQESRRIDDADQGCLELKDLCMKWNTICTSAHRSHRHPSEITFNFSSASPSSSSISSYDRRYPSLHQSQHPWLTPLGAKYPWRDHQLWLREMADEDQDHNSRSNAEAEEMDAEARTLPLSCRLIPASDPNSASTSSGAMEVEHPSKYKELNAENLKTLCAALEKRVPWQQDIVPEIASTVLKCRSGMVRRKDKSSSSAAGCKEETWLFFQGGDNDGKERVARELASLVFGSSSKLVSIGLSDFDSTSARSDSTDDSTRNKRTRADTSHCYLELLFEAMSENPRRVVLIQDVEQVDPRTQAAIKSAIERGKVKSYSGDEVGVGDAIIILSCESFDCRSRACSPPVKHKAGTSSPEEKEEGGGGRYDVEVGTNCLALDLNLCVEDQDLDDDVDVVDGGGSCHNVGLLDLVDRAFFFKIPSSDL